MLCACYVNVYKCLFLMRVWLAGPELLSVFWLSLIVSPICLSLSRFFVLLTYSSPNANIFAGTTLKISNFKKLNFSFIPYQLFGILNVFCIQMRCFPHANKQKAYNISLNTEFLLFDHLLSKEKRRFYHLILKKAHARFRMHACSRTSNHTIYKISM